MRTLFAFALILIHGAALAQTPPPPASNPGASTNLALSPAYINSLAEELRARHPALQAAWARTNAAAANLQAVRTWEDPMARVGGMAAREELRADDGDIIYGAEQKLPLFGKPQLARRVARAELATETANAEYQFQILRRDLAKLAFATALANEVVNVGQQDLVWLETMSQTMENKYRAGQATLVEVLQLQNERAKRATQLQTDRDRLAHDQFSLNRMLNRDAAAPWPNLELPPLAPAVPYSQKLVDYAFKYEPRLQMMRQQIKQSEAAVELTRRQRWPDVSAGLEVRNYSGDGSFRQGILMLSMNVPWVNTGKYRNDIKREEAKRTATEFDLADYQLTLREEVHQLTVKIDAARREALLYQTEILPRSQTALESARVGWESARNSFRDLLEARRMLLEAKLMYARAISEQYQMLSELVLCCGIGDLEALQMLSSKPSSQPEK